MLNEKKKKRCNSPGGNFGPQLIRLLLCSPCWYLVRAARQRLQGQLVVGG